MLRLPKVISILSVTSSLLLGSVAQADCQFHYQMLLKKAQVEQTRNAIGSVGLTIVSLLFPPAGILKLGSLALQTTVTVKGVKIFLSKHELERIARMLDQANAGAGAELEMAHNIVTIDRPETNLQWVAAELRKNNSDNVYCTADHLANFEEIMMSIGVEPKTAKKSLSIVEKLMPIQTKGPINALEIPPTLISDNSDSDEVSVE